MMNISKETDYALRIVHLIAEKGNIVNAETISANVESPLCFTLKILDKLVSAGVVIFHEGTDEGYELARSSKEITLREIIEIIEEPLIISRCTSEDLVCRNSNNETDIMTSSNLDGLTIYDSINVLKTSQDNKSNILMETALLASVMVLENGGETFRAEETALTICKMSGDNGASVIAFPTGIIISVNSEIGKITTLERIKIRKTNLYIIERVNFFSRSFADGHITLKELNKRLVDLKNKTVISNFKLSLFAGMSSGFFTLLFQSDIKLHMLFDFAIAAISTFFMIYMSLSSRLKNAYQFTSTFLGTAFITTVSVILTKIFGIGNLDCIIIGAIFPLLPGISMTNAIRDTVTGDIISGASRLIETLIIAIAIAGGAGVVLSLYISITGGTI